MSTSQTVFIVEDDPAVSAMVMRVCKSLNLHALTFASMTALREAEGCPDIILLDLGLSDGNGVDVLRNLAAERCSATIYLMSGQDARLLKTVQKLGESYGLSVRGVLQKPFALADLKEILTAPTGDARQPASMSGGDELHRAIMSGELRLHFQPKVSIRTRAATGCEALVRWEHPQRGLVPPADFLPAVEQFGLMPTLTRWVIDAALDQLSAWRAEGYRLNVAVNMPADMLNELALPGLIRRLLDRHDLPSSELTLEVTESAAVRSLQTAVDVLARLRLMQVSLSIDDFGTGHASIVKLRQLPFNELKIDRSFVQDLTVDEDARVLVSAMIAIGRSFGMRTVAEGVEHEEELAVLAELGCDYAQGYFVGLPMPADRFMDWLAKNDAKRTRPVGDALFA